MTGTQEFISYNIATTVVNRTGIYQHREDDRPGKPYAMHIVRFYYRPDDRSLSLSYIEHGDPGV